MFIRSVKNIIATLDVTVQTLCSWHIFGSKCIYMSLCTIHIQGDSGGICNTLGNNSMCDSKQKSSYEGWNFNSGNYLFTIDTK